MAVVGAVLAVLLAGAGARASESESAAFVLDTSSAPVTLSVIEISAAVGLMPAPVVACAVWKSFECALGSGRGKGL